MHINTLLGSALLFLSVTPALGAVGKITTYHPNSKSGIITASSGGPKTCSFTKGDLADPNEKLHKGERVTYSVTIFGAECTARDVRPDPANKERGVEFEA